MHSTNDRQQLSLAERQARLEGRLEAVAEFAQRLSTMAKAITGQSLPPELRAGEKTVAWTTTLITHNLDLARWLEQAALEVRTEQLLLDQEAGRPDRNVVRIHSAPRLVKSYPRDFSDR